jgi:hypothetical protein
VKAQYKYGIELFDHLVKTPPAVAMKEWESEQIAWTGWHKP